MLSPLMNSSRAVQGMGWVHAPSRRVALPGAEGVGPAPEGAFPLEIAEREAGPFAVVHGAALSEEELRVLRDCLSGVVEGVAFLVASDRGAHVVDGSADVVACAESLEVLRAASSSDPVRLVRGGARAAYLDARFAAPVLVTRDEGAVAARYRSARTFGLVRADLDWLIAYNDWLGVLQGDLLLARVLGLACEIAYGALAPPGALVSLARRDVLLALVDVDAAATVAIAEALAERLRRERVQLRHETVHAPYMTLSAGAVFVGEPARIPLSRALAAADEAVLEAKRAGRNRIAIARLET
jgi:GGDEF domain-containing protein